MTLGSLALEQSHFAPLGTQSVFGYLNGTHILPVLWLAIVPGILGHQVLYRSHHRIDMEVGSCVGLRFT